MSPASLLTCLLPLHNRGQINVKYDFWVQSVKREEEKRERRGERRHRLSPNGGLLQLKIFFFFFKQGNQSARSWDNTENEIRWIIWDSMMSLKKKGGKKGHFVKQLMRASLSARFRIIFSTEDSSPPSSLFIYFFTTAQLLIRRCSLISVVPLLLKWCTFPICLIKSVIIHITLLTTTLMTVIYENSLITHHISQEKLIISFVKLPSSSVWSRRKRRIFSQFSLHIHLRNDCPVPTTDLESECSS